MMLHIITGMAINIIVFLLIPCSKGIPAKQMKNTLCGDFQKHSKKELEKYYEKQNTSLRMGTAFDYYDTYNSTGNYPCYQQK